MKRAFLVIIFLTFSQFIFSQNINELAFSNIQKIEIRDALNQFEVFKTPENKKRIDSLKKNERKNLKKEISGTWEYIKSKCSDCVLSKNKIEEPRKFIKITNRKIVYYLDKISTKNIIQTEELKFTEHFDFMSNLKDVLFSDKTIWSLNVDKSNEFLKIYNSGYETENGRAQIFSGLIVEYYKRIK
jgi:hypothetical protein